MPSRPQSPSPPCDLHVSGKYYHSRRQSTGTHGRMVPGLGCSLGCLQGHSQKDRDVKEWEHAKEAHLDAIKATVAEVKAAGRNIAGRITVAVAKPAQHAAG